MSVLVGAITRSRILSALHKASITCGIEDHLANAFSLAQGIY